MKRTVFYVILLFLLLGCEEKIDLELNTSQPKLVIDASIDWFKGTPGNEQNIKLTLTAPYFDTEIPPATGAIVFIEDSRGNIFDFSEQGKIGVYQTSEFIPEIGMQYFLTITYEGETYTGTETLKSVVDFDFVEQKDEGGFSGEETELKIYYTDSAVEENYYFFEFLNENNTTPTLEVYEDQFTDGNQIFGFYSDEDLETGDEVTIRNYGVSESFYEFMFILLQQSSDDSGGPFETQPATVRGNCRNMTDPENYPLGYFRLSQVAELVYTVQ